MTNDIARKAQTGEPTTNGGHFGSVNRPEAPEGLLKGFASPVSSSALLELIEVNGRARLTAERDMELAAAALLAREIKELHPAATYVVPSIEYDDEGDSWVSGVDVYDAKLEHLVSYVDNETTADYTDSEFDQVLTDLAKVVGKEGSNSHWAAHLADSLTEPMISVAKASVWAPDH
jgi:hypothetical protein